MGPNKNGCDQSRKYLERLCTNFYIDIMILPCCSKSFFSSIFAHPKRKRCIMQLLYSPCRSVHLFSTGNNPKAAEQIFMIFYIKELYSNLCIFLIFVEIVRK
jgi:hypothetical protein